MRGVQREARVDLVRDMATAVVFGDQFEVDARRVPFSRFVLVAKVGNGDLVSHDLESVAAGDLSATTRRFLPMRRRA